MKGSVMPVSGSRRVTPAMIRKVCRPSANDRPPARSLRKESREWREIPKPTATSSAYVAITATLPARPSSSPTAANGATPATAPPLDVGEDQPGGDRPGAEKESSAGQVDGTARSRVEHGNEEREEKQRGAQVALVYEHYKTGRPSDDQGSQLPPFG